MTETVVPDLSCACEYADVSVMTQRAIFILHRAILVIFHEIRAQSEIWLHRAVLVTENCQIWVQGNICFHRENNPAMKRQVSLAGSGAGFGEVPADRRAK